MDEEDAGASTPRPAHVLASLAQCRDRSGRKVRRFSSSCLVLPCLLTFSAAVMWPAPPALTRPRAVFVDQLPPLLRICGER